MHDYDDLIAYFSMEIALQEGMPTYSGGLGVLAGDTLKAFADLGMDTVALTLLSEKGYFLQSIDDTGVQHELENGWNMQEFLHKLDAIVDVTIFGRKVLIGAWEYFIFGVNGKRIRVLFLDTNMEGNSEEDKRLTSYLYGGDLRYRLQQEIILGIGGVRMLRKLGYAPKKFHMNEGHAAFLVLELYKELSVINNMDERVQAIRERCSFTTHTPVPAGHDSFNKDEVRNAVGDLIPPEILNMASKGNDFSMSLLALNFSAYTNAVSRKHQGISSLMFPEFNIDYITNGVHAASWVSPAISSTLDKNIPDWRKNSLDLRNSLRIPLSEISAAHSNAKKELIDFVNSKGGKFKNEIFTIGFARRATGYKRAELLFRDIERLRRINRDVGEMQIVFAGKAHPRDFEGKKIIQRIVERMKSFDQELKVVFLENYDMKIAKLMTSGCDLWLNTPKRPLEASGTSGMKAAMNGVPSFSILDGWWIEGCVEGVTGWAIGKEIPSEQEDAAVDAADAEDLYSKLEKTILPLYYGSPEKYAEIMRSTIAINGAYFNTNRMAKQYLVRAYARKQHNILLD